MNKEALATYKKSLDKLQISLIELDEISQEASKKVELDQSRIGRLSRMDALQGQQMALATNRRRLLQLKKIQGALLRIEKDEYGDCFTCGEAIDTRRLAADPTSTRCIDCLQEA